MTTRTLIILGSSLTALAVARVAWRTGLQCVMVDVTAGPAACTRTAEFVRVASADAEAVVRSMDRLRGRADVAVVADSDRWLRVIVAQGDRLAAERWLVLHPSASALRCCLDKSAFLSWCAQQGLPAPRVYAEADARQVPTGDYPLMLRPEWTQHSSNTGLPKALEVRRPDELATWLARYADVAVTPSICQSLLRPGLRQFSVGAARNRSGAVLTFLAEKIRPHAEQCAGGTYVVPAVARGVEALAARALDALSYFGVAEVEILFDPTTSTGYLIEVNARPWLQYGLPYACGLDLLGFATDRTGGADGPRSQSHAWLYFTSDLYACFSRSSGLVRTGKVAPLRYLRSILGADVYATWDWRDPGPLLEAFGRTVNGRWQRLVGRPRPAS